MALDIFGNYVCDLPPQGAPFPASGRCCITGNGAPDISIGINGQTYVDLDTGDLYVKAGDVWAIVAGGSGGVVKLGLVDPEGFVAFPEGTPYLNTILKTFWIKQDGGSGNTGWTPQLI